MKITDIQAFPVFNGARNNLFVTVDTELNNVKLTADNQGQATWQPPVPGNYAVYTSSRRKESGAVDGKKYEEILSSHRPGGPNGGTQPSGGNGGFNGNERYSGRRPETRATSRPDRQDPPTSREKPPEGALQ